MSLDRDRSVEADKAFCPADEGEEDVFGQELVSKCGRIEDPYPRSCRCKAMGVRFLGSPVIIGEFALIAASLPSSPESFPSRTAPSCSRGSQTLVGVGEKALLLRRRGALRCPSQRQVSKVGFERRSRLTFALSCRLPYRERELSS
jgi:hypothetical protein